MNTETLNKKLLKFAEIEYKIHTIDIKGESYLRIDTTGYFFKDKLICKSAPDLVHNLNAQAKYLYPKLKCITKTNGFKGWITSLNFGTGTIPCFIGEDNSEAVSLALAVEKYLDSLK